MQPSARLLLAGSIFGFLSVAIGAFGAHMLKPTLEANHLQQVFETGVQYQVAHSLALILLAALCDRPVPANRLLPVAWCFCIGIVIFSGSLYALAVSGAGWLGAVTPFGGLAFLAGWALLAAAALRQPGVPPAAGDP